ncbi:MAG: DUF4118 domain-containing protein [Chloroflexota bacterium]|nr:DUF4118 domain-containing protein [Chloroflexota bacterium]
MHSAGSFQQPTWPWQRLVAEQPYLWSVAIVALVTIAAWLLQQGGMSANFTALYLVGVLLCASSAGRWPALVCAVLSFLAFKFFFVPPIFTLTVDDTRDVLHLLVFLVTALIGGRMAVRVREQAMAAQQLANETTALYDLSQAISTQLEFDRIAPLIIDTTLRILPCQACCLYLLAADGSLSEVAQGGQWHASASLAEASLYSGSQTIGVLRVALAPGQAPLDAGRQRLLNTL